MVARTGPLPAREMPWERSICTAVIGARSQAEKACDLPSVAELTIIDLACHDGGTGRTDAFKSNSWSALLLGLLARCRALVALLFDSCNLLLDKPSLSISRAIS